jgi:hypothetical protein
MRMRNRSGRDIAMPQNKYSLCRASQKAHRPFATDFVEYFAQIGSITEKEQQEIFDIFAIGDSSLQEAHIGGAPLLRAPLVKSPTGLSPGLSAVIYESLSIEEVRQFLYGPLDTFIPGSRSDPVRVLVV